MTMYDMCFYFANHINETAYNSYCQNMTKEESQKNPFYYPFEK